MASRKIEDISKVTNSEELDIIAQYARDTRTEIRKSREFLATLPTIPNLPDAVRKDMEKSTRKAIAHDSESLQNAINKLVRYVSEGVDEFVNSNNPEVFLNGIEKIKAFRS